jgi:hypothetical protein
MLVVLFGISETYYDRIATQGTSQRVSRFHAGAVSGLGLQRTSWISDIADESGVEAAGIELVT